VLVYSEPGITAPRTPDETGLQGAILSKIQLHSKRVKEQHYQYVPVSTILCIYCHISSGSTHDSITALWASVLVVLHHIDWPFLILAFLCSWESLGAGCPPWFSTLVLLLMRLALAQSKEGARAPRTGTWSPPPVPLWMPLPGRVEQSVPCTVPGPLGLGHPDFPPGCFGPQPGHRPPTMRLFIYFLRRVKVEGECGLGGSSYRIGGRMQTNSILPYLFLSVSVFKLF